MDTVFKQSLKAKAHHLKPVVYLGSKGLTQQVIEETDISLKAHELIKVKIKGIERKERQEIAITLCQQLHAELIQLIGNIVILYRKNDE